MTFLGWVAMVLEGRARYLQASFQIENARFDYPCCMN